MKAAGELEPKIGALLDASDGRAAVIEALRGYGPEVLGYLFATLREEDAAQDVFSQFSEDLCKGIDRYRRECSMRTWCYKLAWEAARRWLRDPYRCRGKQLVTGEWAEIAAEVHER